MTDNFLDLYLTYAKENEVPTFFHRWCCLSGIGALLGRQYSLPLGHMIINSNMYVMLIGTPGTRKNTAINLMRDLLIKSGYNTIAADKVTKEKFLMDLAGVESTFEETDIKRQNRRTKQIEDFLDSNLWGEGEDNDKTKPPAEVFIVAPEFNDFLGNGNIEFLSLLGNLWDYSGVYRNRIKNGKSIAINDPTINIIGGNTPTGFSLAFPVEIFGQGFFSRLILVYGEPSGKKIAFPKMPAAEDTARVVSQLAEVKKHARGVAVLASSAESLLSDIYHTWKPFDDPRFESYANRRFTHLLKLCLTVSACHYRGNVTERDVIIANTILSYTEILMPRALGEFGKAKNSDVAHRIVRLIESADMPLGMRDIWSHVQQDLDSMRNLSDILISLQEAGKIMHMKGIGNVAGWVTKKKVVKLEDGKSVDWSIFSDEERKRI